MKAREERRKTLIRARMRSAASWSDVCILNLSPGGAGLQSANPPERGTYVEIRRGAHVIVARVAWSSGHRFGVRAQERLPVALIIAEPSAGQRESSADRPAERRAVPRAQTRHERSRTAARAAEFACIAVAGAAAAVTLYGIVQSALASPLSAISTAMNGQPGG